MYKICDPDPEYEALLGIYKNNFLPSFKSILPVIEKNETFPFSMKYYKQHIEFKRCFSGKSSERLMSQKNKYIHKI